MNTTLYDACYNFRALDHISRMPIYLTSILTENKDRQNKLRLRYSARRKRLQNCQKKQHVLGIKHFTQIKSKITKRIQLDNKKWGVLREISCR